MQTPEPKTSGNTADSRSDGDSAFLKPLGDYQEAYSAIDNIDGMSGDVPKDNAGASKPAGDTPKPSAKPPDKAKPTDTGKESENPKAPKKSLGDDLDSVLKPKPKTEPKVEPKPQDGENDPDKVFEHPETPKALRETYKRTKDELSKASARLKELETQVEASRREASETVRSELNPRIAAAERRAAELESELRFANYERSEDFNSRYQTPLREAWESAITQFEGMTITDAHGNEREFAPPDMARLMSLPNAQARKFAQEMFGTAAPEVMAVRAKLMDLTNARSKALEEWKTKGSEREKQIADQRKAVREQWDTSIKEYQNEYPDLFGPADGDSEGNALLDKGLSIVRTAFVGEGLPDGITPAQKHEAVLAAQTLTSIRAMAFPRLLRNFNKAQSEIEELKAKLAEYEGSEPGQGNRNHGDEGRSSRGRSPEDEIDALPAYR